MIERIRPKSHSNLGGRPTKYQPAYARTCTFLAQRGATVAEMADACDVNTRTFYRWLSEYQELNDAVASGKDAFDTRVERALAEQAIGFSVDVEEVFVIKGKLETKIVRKYFPPNVTAGIYWSKNRMPDLWRDVQRHEVNPTRLRSSEEIRQQLLEEFKDLIDQGLLQLPVPGR
jgi:AcrR family transcriptional regulator